MGGEIQREIQRERGGGRERYSTRDRERGEGRDTMRERGGEERQREGGGTVGQTDR